MVGTFFALAIWSTRNRFVTRFRRLREPRYLVGSILGAVWFYFFVIRNLFQAARAGHHVRSPVEAVMQHADYARFLIALVLFGMALVIGLWPGTRRPLEFTRAEVQFLFPAPIARRQLVHYKLLRSQLGLLFGAVIAALLFRPATLRDGWMFSVGVWIVLTVYRLYSIAVGLLRGGGGAEQGAGGLRRRWGFATLLVGAVVVLGLAAIADRSHLAALSTRGEVLEELRRIWSTGAARIVLWPFVTLARLPFAGEPATFAATLPGALLLVAVAYAAVLSTDRAFEEAAAAHAETAAARRPGKPAPKVKGRLPPFKLALEGRPEIALFWKNLTLLGRFASAKTLLFILPFVLIFAPAVGRGGSRTAASMISGLCLTFAAMIVFMGPQVTRNDLRQDLGKLAVLKSWPIPGRALVRGELLAPAIVLSVLVCLLILVAALMFGSIPARGGRTVALLAHRASYAATAILVAPSAILAQLVVQNGIAVLFPAWMTLGRDRHRGIDATGQQMLVMWGGLLAAIVFLAPAAAGAGAVLLALYLATHAIVLVVPALVLLAIVLAQSWLVTGWLGRVLNRTDIGAVESVED